MVIEHRVIPQANLGVFAVVLLLSVPLVHVQREYDPAALQGDTIFLDHPCAVGKLGSHLVRFQVVGTLFDR